MSPALRPRNLRSLWPLLFLAVAFRVGGNTVNRMVYPFLPVFAQDLGVSLPVLTRGLGWRVAAGVVALPLILWAERRPRHGVLFGTGLFTLFLLWTAGWPTWSVFLSMVLGVLVAKMVADIALQDWLSRRIAYRERGLPLAFLELGWSMSFFLGMPVVAWLLQGYGWRVLFLAWAGYLALGGLAVAALMHRLEKQERAGRGGQDPHHGSPEVLENLPGPADSNPVPASALSSGRAGGLGILTFPHGLRGFWQRHGQALLWGVLPGLLFALAATLANEVIGLVFGDWLYRTYGLRLGGLGLAAVVIGVGEAMGEFASMALVDRLGKRRAVMWGVAGLVGASALFPWLGTRNLTGALVGLALAFATYEFSLVSSIPMMTAVWPSHRGVTMLAFATALILGRSVAAWVLPWVYLPWGVGGAGVAAALAGVLAWLALFPLREGEM